MNHQERTAPMTKFSCSLQCEARIVRVTRRLRLDQSEGEFVINPTNREGAEIVLVTTVQLCSLSSTIQSAALARQS